MAASSGSRSSRGGGSNGNALDGLSISQKLALIYGVLHGLLAVALMIGLATSWETFRFGYRDRCRRPFRLLLAAIILAIVGLILGAVVYCTSAMAHTVLDSMTFTRLADLSASFNRLSWSVGVACVGNTATSVYYCTTGKRLRFASSLILSTGWIMALIVLVLLGWWQANYTKMSYIDDPRSQEEYWNMSQPFRILGSVFTVIGFGTSLIFICLTVMTVRVVKAAGAAGRTPLCDIPDAVLTSLKQVTMLMRHLLVNNLAAWGIGLVSASFQLREQSPGPIWAIVSFVAEVTLQCSVFTWVLAIGRHTTSGIPTLSQRWRGDFPHRPPEQDFMSERGVDDL